MLELGELIHKQTLDSELCTAVKMMFSLEQILRITGGRECRGCLERVAYTPCRSRWQSTRTPGSITSRLTRRG